MESTTQPTSDWRSLIKVHPAADDFPRLSPDDQKELVEDIKAHGLKSPVTTWRDKDGTEWMLDGRNRLDAMAAAGYCFKLHAQWRPDHQPRDREKFKIVPPKGAIPYLTLVTHYLGDDPYAYVVSANIRRRHLTGAQKGELIAALLKADPTKSDRAIAEVAKVSPQTVTAKRTKLEAGAQIEQVKERAGRDGKTYKQSTKPAMADALVDDASPEPAEAEPEYVQAERLPPLYDAWATTVRVTHGQLTRLLKAEASAALFFQDPKNAAISRKLRDLLTSFLEPRTADSEPETAGVDAAAAAAE